MKELPNVKNVDSNTAGIYSDMYGFTFLNGRLLSLSNQQYYNNKMIYFEGAGPPVDIQILNTKSDLQKTNDHVLVAGIKVLSQNVDSSSTILIRKIIFY